jgi:heme-degrading monooxygenase HmoA
MPESNITTPRPLTTLVNVFSVDPADQQRLIERWQQATVQLTRHLPGFVSANIHRSLHGTTVVKYAHWESQAALGAMPQHPDAAPHLAELTEIGTPAPVVCELVSIHGAPDGDPR